MCNSQQPCMLTFHHRLELGGPLPLLILDSEFFQLFHTLRLGHLQRPVLLRQSLKFPNQLSSIQLLLFRLVQLGNELLSEMQGTGQEAQASLQTYPESALTLCTSRCLPFWLPAAYLYFPLLFFLFPSL